MSKHRFYSVIIIVLTTLLLVASTVGAASMDSVIAAAAKQGPVVTLSAAQTSYSASQDVLLTLTFTNPTQHSLRILKWFTPVEDVVEPIFAVKVNGTSVAYNGPIYKRPAATGSDYLTLKSGESLSYTVNLGEFYDLSVPGIYLISYKASFATLYDEKGSVPEALTSESIVLKVDGQGAKGKRPTPTPTPTSIPDKTSFKACTTAQQTTLRNARTQATSYASTAKSYLAGINSGTSRYTEWFGIFTDTRFRTVTSHFDALADAWATKDVTFDCGCRQNAYAYVYPNKAYEIYLCKVFWAAPLAGTDSQGGTLIHEMSHFTVVAGTDDYVYGQSGARSLADTSPDQAIMNADNHEYFAENNPSLP